MIRFIIWSFFWVIVFHAGVWGQEQSLSASSAPDLLSSDPYYEMRDGLTRSYWRFENTKKGRIAFLGGSITYNPGWRDSVIQYLERRFPDTEFDFISAGIPSMGSTPGAFRLERDVLVDGPVDLLFEEAAVNDATNGRTQEEQICGMEGIVRQVRSANPAADIVLMHLVDPDKMTDYRAGRVPEVIINHERVAEHYGLPSIHLAREVTDRIDAGEFTWGDDFRDLHPSPFGQGVYARSIIGFLEKAWELARSQVPKDNGRDLPQKLNTLAYDAGKLEEVNANMEVDGWGYQSNWTPKDGAGTRENYTEVPMLIGEQPGSVLRYSFVGRAVGIAVAAGPDAGTIEYRIDEGDWQSLDLFTPWSVRLHLPWYYTLFPNLQSSQHLLEIRLIAQHNPKSKGTVCRIRYFYVNR